MKFSDTKSLSEFRIEQNKHQEIELNGCTAVQLYGVCNNLNQPVINIIRMSKRFLYDDFDNKYSYHDSFNTANKIPDMIVFTSASEAWHHFRQMLYQREEALRLHYEIESNDINRAKSFMLESIKKTPEYFI